MFPISSSPSKDTGAPKGEWEHFLQLSDGRTLAYLIIGDPRGHPILYCHGFPGSRMEGRLATSAACRLGLRLIAPDRPGFGRSTFQVRRTIGAWAADIAELADHLALEQLSVVGVSGGGPYALACAARIPQRVRALALVGALGPLRREQLTNDMATMNRLVLKLALHWPAAARFGVRLAMRWVRGHPEHYLSIITAGAPPEDRKVLRNKAYRTLIAESTIEALRQGGRGAAWDLKLLVQPWDFKLEEVSVPARIWQGLADNIVPPAMARCLAAGLADSECHYIPNEGHLSLIARHLHVVLADLCD